MENLRFDRAFEGMKVLVTGGAGFIGSNLAIALLENGARVRVFDNLSTGKLANLEGYLNGIEFMEGDLRDPDAIAKAVKGVEVVFHQGALPSVPRSIEDPLTTDQVNAGGTLNLLLAARSAGVRRVVYASSSSVYGDSPTLPKTEDMPVDPKSPYALSKFAGERHCQLFTRLYGLETVSLRYFNVFGPRQDPTSQYAAVIPRFISGIVGGKGITIYGDGEQTRDFTYIDNVVSANLLAAVTCGASGPAETPAGQKTSGPPETCSPVGETINVACGERIAVLELARFLMRTMGKEVPVEWSPARPGEVRDSLASIEKARRLLGYEPAVDVWKGLETTIGWFSG